MKVKLIRHSNIDSFEKELNDFLETIIRHSNINSFSKELNDFLETLTDMGVDIKFSTSVGKSGTMYNSASVVYSYK